MKLNRLLKSALFEYINLLLLNWMQKSPLSKILLVAFFSGLLNLAEYIYRILGAFACGNGFNPLISYIQSLAPLSILV